MKKVFAVSTLLLCFLLSGFYFQRGTQNTEYDSAGLAPRVLLTFLGFQYDSENRLGIEHILDMYTQSHPTVLVSYESIPLPHYFQILNQRVKMNSMDDVFMVSPYDARRYAAQERLADLAELPTLSAYRPEVLEQMRLGGIVPYMTNSLGAFGLYCNIRELNRRNIAVPQNLGMLLTACKTLRNAGITPLAFGNKEALKALVIARSFRHALSGDAETFFTTLGEDSECLENVLAEGLSFLALLRDCGYLDVTVFSELNAERSPAALFENGKSPFMIGGIWISPRLARQRPGLWFRVFPLPVRESGGIAVLGLDTPLAVNKGGKHLRQAFDLVKSMTEPDATRVFNDDQGLFSPLKNARPKDSAVHPLWDCMNTGKAVFHSDVRLRHPIWKALDAGVEMILSGASGEEAAKKVARLLLTEEKGASAS